MSLAVVAGSSGCTGDEGSECRATRECRDPLECAGPDEPQVCGIPARELCNSDADCLDGTPCHAIADPCSADGVGSECLPSCNEGGCGEGFSCDLERGACVAITCAQGWTCASFETCEPAVDPDTPVHAQAHGCVAIACGSDEACASGDACVNGVCQSGPGACVMAQAVP